MPAGHVANVMACASFLNHRFEMRAVEPALYAVALSVGVGRLIDRRHWNSDNVLGMAFGYAIGKEVAKRSISRSASAGPKSNPGGEMFFEPTAAGLAMGWKRTF